MGYRWGRRFQAAKEGGQNLWVVEEYVPQLCFSRCFLVGGKGTGGLLPSHMLW